MLGMPELAQRFPLRRRGRPVRRQRRVRRWFLLLRLVAPFTRLQSGVALESAVAPPRLAVAPRRLVVVVLQRLVVALQPGPAPSASLLFLPGRLARPFKPERNRSWAPQARRPLALRPQRAFRVLRQRQCPVAGRRRKRYPSPTHLQLSKPDAQRC